MQWKINHFIFCSKKQTLSYIPSLNKQQKIQLEPKQAEVLAYFCHHPEQLITRDELVEHVWQGQAVTDNAVNRIIAKLRKSLGDTAKQSDFIVTLPRKGYQWIASVEVVAEQKAVHQNRIKINPYITVSILLGVVLLVATIWQAFIATTKMQHTTSVTALTREAGQEYLPSISPNGQYLIYSTYDGKQLKLYLKDLKTNHKQLISDELGSAGGGNWSKDGQKFVYLYTQADQCELRIIEFSQQQPMEPIKKSTVHQCPEGSYGLVAFDHENQHIIYSESKLPGPSEPYYIYKKNLQTNVITKLPQPPIYLGGNSQFDLHPYENKLLIASPNEKQRLAFYQLNLDKNKLEYLFEKDEYVCCPIWDHAGKKVVMIGPHPAYAVVAMELDGSDMQTIYNSSHLISKLKKYPNGKDFIYSGGIQNIDIFHHSFASEENSIVVNSTVRDELPSVSNDDTQLAFISNRTDMEQIWIKDLSNNNEKMLTQFNDHRKYYALSWSPNDEKIAALTINSIKIINIKTGAIQQVKIAQQQIRGISWVSNDTLSFSLNKQQKWQVHHYIIPSNKLIELTEDWAYANYSESHGNLFIDSNNHLYLNNKKLSIMLTTPINHHRNFFLQQKHDGIYYINKESDNYILMHYQHATEKIKKLIALNAGKDFSISDKGIYFSKVLENSADIFKTNFNQP